MKYIAPVLVGIGLVVCLFLVVAILLTAVLSFPLTGALEQTTNGGALYPKGQGSAAVVQWATLMAEHLHGTPDVTYDAGFPQAILQYGERTCPGCSAWQNGNFQCVVFVLGAYGYVHPFPLADNADVWWEEYAHEPGYREIPAAAPGQRGLPAPGDVMAWSGGLFGHVSIVLAVQKPTSQSDGAVTFAQANGQMPIQTLPLSRDLIVNTANGYWNAFTVLGYIRLIGG